MTAPSTTPADLRGCHEEWKCNGQIPTTPSGSAPGASAAHPPVEFAQWSSLGLSACIWSLVWDEPLTIVFGAVPAHLPVYDPFPTLRSSISVASGAAVISMGRV
jgi:hypothetical protein